MIMQRMDADNCRDAGGCGSCTTRLSSFGRLSTPKALTPQGDDRGIRRVGDAGADGGGG